MTGLPGFPFQAPWVRFAGARARALAAWYAHRGRLARVDDPLDVDDALTPGALVFFGAPGRTEVALDQAGQAFMESRDAVQAKINDNQLDIELPGDAGAVEELGIDGVRDLVRFP